MMSSSIPLRVLPDDIDGAAEPAPLERVRDFDLDPPVTFQKREFTRLHLCEPTGKQAETAERELAGAQNIYTTRRYMITLISMVAKVPREVVEGMRVTEIETCFDFLGPLLRNGPATGETS